jgi:hypothetical protein
MMDVREESENVSDSILQNHESDSIETYERDLQSEKQEEPRISAVREMMMDVREKSENASDLIAQTKCSLTIWTINRRRANGPADDYFAVIASPSILSHPSLHVWGKKQFPQSFHVTFPMITTFEILQSVRLTNYLLLLSPNFLM